MHNRNTVRAAFVAMAAALVAVAGAASAVDVQTTTALPLKVELSATSSDCSNNPGPHVTLSGLVAFGSLDVTLRFQNNDKGTHPTTETTTVNAALDFGKDNITIPKQPVEGGAGGNPFIWVQFTDADGNAISDEIFLGRCVQGLDASVLESLSVPAAVSLALTGDNCTNNPGPNIYFQGGVSVSGVNARIIFRNNDNKVGGPHQDTVETSATVEVVPDGQSLVIPKQPVLGGVGGNPKVWLLIGDEEFYLGRCVQDL